MRIIASVDSDVSGLGERIHVLKYGRVLEDPTRNSDEFAFNLSAGSALIHEEAWHKKTDLKDYDTEVKLLISRSGCGHPAVSTGLRERSTRPILKHTSSNSYGPNKPRVLLDQWLDHSPRQSRKDEKWIRPAPAGAASSHPPATLRIPHLSPLHILPHPHPAPMFRVAFASVARPAMGLRGPCVQPRAMPSASSVLGALRASRGPLPFARPARTFMTDAAPIVSRPAPQDAWKRLAVTTVRRPHVPTRARG
jgi:hypothetical protein